MRVSDAVSFRFTYKTEGSRFHLQIERGETPDFYKVRAGRGISSDTYLIPSFLWEKFLQALKNLGVFQWEEMYDFPSYDGDGWFVAVVFPNNREVSFAGRYEKPLHFEEFLELVSEFVDHKRQEEPKEVPSTNEEKEVKGEEQESLESDFVPPFVKEQEKEGKLRLEDIFTEEELNPKGENAFDRQVSKFSSFVKTGSHTFVKLIIDSLEEDKE